VTQSMLNVHVLRCPFLTLQQEMSGQIPLTISLALYGLHTSRHTDICSKMATWREDHRWHRSNWSSP
jgi:hypothetical protein